MSRRVTSRGLQIIVIITMLGGAAVILIQKFGPITIYQQMANMESAERHIPVLKPILQRDMRFKDIKLQKFTAADGSLLVSGELYSDQWAATINFPHLATIIIPDC